MKHFRLMAIWPLTRPGIPCISRMALLLAILVPLSVLASPTIAIDSLTSAPFTTLDGHDMLGYLSDTASLVLYDPRTRTETTLLENIRTFRLSRDGRVAFVNVEPDDRSIYVIDPSLPNSPPINITGNRIADPYSLSWSPDGQHLAFGASDEEGNESAYVWDGETVTNIMPENGLDTPEAFYPLLWSADSRYLAFSSHDERDSYSLYVWDGETVANVMPENELDVGETFYPHWGSDGRLLFTIEYGWSSLDRPPEIYLWDGESTTSLSQNPEGWDWGRLWNGNGQVLFYSKLNDEDYLFVWDGVSLKNGSPDTNSFIQIAPGLEPDFASWLDDNLIAFTSSMDAQASGVKAILLWEVERAEVVRRIPITSDNAHSRLSDDGQMIVSSHLASGLPSVYLDIENIEGQILFSEEVGDYGWSADGYLAYCRMDGDWILSLWDGRETWDVVQTSYKPIQWQSGNGIFCNSG